MRLRWLALAAGLLASGALLATPPDVLPAPAEPEPQAEPAPEAQASDAHAAGEVPGAPASAAPQLPFERCGVVHEPARGSVATKVVESIHVLDLPADADFKLPEDAPANVKAVQCGRDSIVPSRNDYKVLLAGFPLSIVARDGRVAVLEASNGKLRLRSLEGKLTEAENAQLQVFLDEAQFAFDKAKLAPTQ